MNFETLKLEINGAIGVLKISRPQALNALNRQVLTDLEAAFTHLQMNSDLRALIVTGDGEKAFVAGADIKEMQTLDPASALKLSQKGQLLLQKLEELPMPTIAAVNGFALGGGLELAMACDVMIASSKAKIGLPEVSLGLIPGYGGTQRLARYVGKSIARMIAMSGDIFPAEKAYQWGLFAEVVEPDQLLATAQKIAGSFAQRSPVALRLAKRAINAGFDLPQSKGMELEAQLFSDTFKTQDHSEGIKAFIEKRPPQFTGR